MDISKYEEQYLKELKKASEKQLDPADFFDKSKSKKERISGIEETFGLRTEADVAKAAEILRDKAEPVEVRVSAINLISYKIGEQINLIELMFSIIKDVSEPSDLRRGALRALQQGSFTSALLQSKRAEFLDTLRQVVDDPDPEIRIRVIEQLAKEKDEYVQRRLIEGLEDKKKALVPAERAIQFLGYDLHSEYFPLLRKIVDDPPNQAAKNEAVRLLAADSGSKDMLTEIVQDKTEKSELRQLGAVALQAIAPEEFESQAKQIVMDDADYPEIKSVLIGGVAHFPEEGGLVEDKEFVKKVEDLQDSSSRKLKEIAKTFVSNQGDDKGEA